MRILVFGGTVFLSRAIAEEALRLGHEVTTASRGTSGSPPEGVRHVVHDRDQDSPTDLVDPAAPFDAVIDIARKPSHVGPAVAAMPDAHWTFVSTISVYDDDEPCGSTPETRKLLPAISEDVDLRSSPEAYGGMKVACEAIVRSGATNALVIRPGLIAGPGDPSGRFSYWPQRLVDGGRILAPGHPSDPVQVIDVRDLAAWIVTCTEERRTGTFDGTAPSIKWGEFLERVSEGVGVVPDLAWVDQEFLEQRDLAPWAGPDSIPMWLPQPDHAGMSTIDVSASLAAGLTIRPLAATTHDTLQWLYATPDAPTTGISSEREVELLAAWVTQPTSTT